jgi:hypothetical protein
MIFPAQIGFPGPFFIEFSINRQLRRLGQCNESTMLRHKVGPPNPKKHSHCEEDAVRRGNLLRASGCGHKRLLRFAAKKVAFQEKAKHKAAETAAVRIAGVSPVLCPCLSAANRRRRRSEAAKKVSVPQGDCHEWHLVKAMLLYSDFDGGIP